MSRKRYDTRPPIKAWGDIKYPAEWARDKRCAVSYQCLLNRIDAGWDVEAAIATPAGRGNRKLSADLSPAQLDLISEAGRLKRKAKRCEEVFDEPTRDHCDRMAIAYRAAAKVLEDAARGMT